MSETIPFVETEILLGIIVCNMFWTA